MDQLKDVLAKLAKHRFWILTSVAVLLGIVGFYLTSSTMNSLYTKQKTALDQHFSNMTAVSSAVSTHPNDFSQARMQEKIDLAAEDVKAAWEVQYSRQAPILKWPDNIAVPTLVRKLQDYQPVELKLEFPNEPRSVTDAEKLAYATYFDKQMEALGEIIGVTWVGEASAIQTGGMGGMMGMMGGGNEGGESSGYSDYGGMMGGGMDGMMGGGMDGMMGYGSTSLVPKNRDLVIWPKSSQDELLTSLRLWPGKVPSVYQIMYTQENMWILEGLLNIIKKTNGDAIANFQTSIKEIEFIRIGRAAVGQAGVIEGPMANRMGGLGGEAYPSGGDFSEETEDESGGGGESEGGAAIVAATITTDPANGRYVDAAFTPISGETLRTKMRSDAPEDAYFAVAKRVPVRLRLKIDQRKVQDFLAYCGNADLMLEVRQVRLGETSPAGAMGSAEMGGAGRGLTGMSGGMGASAGAADMGGYGEMMGGGGAESGYGGGAAALADFKKDPWVVDIEVYGVVHLFNPVNIDRLGLNKVTEDTQVADRVDPTTESVETEVVVEPVAEAAGYNRPARICASNN